MKMADDAREIFVRNLAELMRRRGITQADIVVHLGVTSATVSNWCTGKKYPRIDVMQRLADYLQVGLSALTTEDGLRASEDMDRLEAMHLNPRLGLLFDRTRKMDDAAVEAMLKISEEILKERDND
jgi:transcriptional regulator with XRE-family HTH domain